MRRIDITGKKFGKLTVLSYLGQIGGKSFYLCQCECGNFKKGSYYHLTRGVTTSCGCGTREKLYKGLEGRKRQPLYNVYCAMKSRCNNPNNPAYGRYGGRGIKICEEWNDYEKFKEWALNNGYKKGLTVDRIDNDKGYSPENCRLITLREQQRNRRDNVHIEIDGKNYLATDIAKLCGVSSSTVSRWIKAGIIREKIKNGKDTSHNKGRKIKRCTR